MARITDVLTALTIPTLILLYLSVAPYTKIEESFTIQATHDLLAYGFPNKETLISEFDHLKYPELHPVPRTFVAPLLLSWVATPFISMVNGIDRQILVRAILGIYNAFCLLFFRNSIRRTYGPVTANWYSLLQACQFHIMFYASRTLPNFIPFGLSTVAVGLLVEKSAVKKSRHLEPALIILTILGIVFRSELAIFLGTHTVYCFLRGRCTIPAIVVSGIIGVLCGLLLTVPIDSFLWQQVPLWPELQSFLFNVYEGKSVEWGVSPWYYYIINAIPKLLYNPLIPTILIPFGLSIPTIRGSIIDLLAPNLIFVAVYSVQAHKEWRFVCYAIPAITVAGAQGAAWIWTRRSRSLLYQALSLSLVLSCLASLAGSFVFLAISSMNYPGAIALHKLQLLADGTKPNLSVHMDVLTAQTGATLFLQLPNKQQYRNMTGWTFDKTDDKTGDGTILLQPDFWAKFDYALAESPAKCIGAWEQVATIDGLSGIGILRPGDEDPSPLHEESKNSFEASPRAIAWVEAPWAPVTSQLWRYWKLSGSFMRNKVTRGWWVDIKTQPMIKILKRMPLEEVQDRILQQE